MVNSGRTYIDGCGRGLDAGVGRIVAFVFVYKQFTIRLPVRLRSAISSVWLHPLQINCLNSRCNVSMGLYIYPDAMLAWNFFLHESILTFGNLKRMFSSIR